MNTKLLTGAKEQGSRNIEGKKGQDKSYPKEVKSTKPPKSPRGRNGRQIPG